VGGAERASRGRSMASSLASHANPAYGEDWTIPACHVFYETWRYDAPGDTPGAR